MLIDLHMHEKTYSPDSKLAIHEIVERAKFVGLDAVCVTDHDSIGLMDSAKRFSEEYDFPIFIGVEYLTNQGDILAYGINKLPKPNLDAQDFINYVNDLGGACVSAHPYRNNNRGLGDHLYEVKDLAGIEVLNGNSTFAENQLALEACKKLQLTTVGGSDSHAKGQVGIFTTRFAKKITSVQDIADALRAGQTEASFLSGYKPVNSL